MVAFVAAAVAAIATALEGVTVGGLIAAAQVAIVSLFAADAFIDWLDTNAIAGSLVVGSLVNSGSALYASVEYNNTLVIGGGGTTTNSLAAGQEWRILSIAGLSLILMQRVS